MESATQRRRETADVRNAALRVLLTHTDAAGNGFLGIRDQLKCESISQEFALCDRHYGLRTKGFLSETYEFKLASPAIWARLAAALNRGGDASTNAALGGGGDASAGGFVAARAARAPERAMVAIAALRNSTDDIIEYGVIEALVPTLRRAVEDRARARASLAFDACAMLMGVHEEHPRFAAISDALMDVGFLDVVGAVATTLGPEDAYLCESCFFALARVDWIRPSGLPRLSSEFITNLLEVLGETAHVNYEVSYALIQIADAHIQAKKVDWPEDAPRVSCAPGVLDPLVSPRGLSIMANLISRRHMGECAGILYNLLYHADMVDYARTVGACDELLDALFTVLGLDAACDHDYMLSHPRRTVTKNHYGYTQPYETVLDPRVDALEALEVLALHRAFGAASGERLRPLGPLLINILLEYSGSGAQPGPQNYNARSISCNLITYLCGKDCGLSRALVDANVLDALMAVLARTRLPESTATDELVGQLEEYAVAAILALIATGQMIPARAAIRDSPVFQPGATDFANPERQRALWDFAHMTNAGWDAISQSGWIQSIICQHPVVDFWHL